MRRLPEAAVADPDRPDLGWTLRDLDGQRGRVEPAVEAGGVAAELDPRDPSRIAARARIAHAGIAADEERQERLAHRLRDAGEARAQSLAPDGGDGRVEPA